MLDDVRKEGDAESVCGRVCTVRSLLPSTTARLYRINSRSNFILAVWACQTVHRLLFCGRLYRIVISLSRSETAHGGFGGEKEKEKAKENEEHEKERKKHTSRSLIFSCDFSIGRVQEAGDFDTNVLVKSRRWARCNARKRWRIIGHRNYDRYCLSDLPTSVPTSRGYSMYLFRIDIKSLYVHKLDRSTRWRRSWRKNY